MLPPRGWVDLGAMAMKRCSAFHKASALLEPHHQIAKRHISATRSMGGGSYFSAEKHSLYILQHRLIGLTATYVLFRAWPPTIKWPCVMSWLGEKSIKYLHSGLVVLNCSSGLRGPYPPAYLSAGPSWYFDTWATLIWRMSNGLSIF